MFFQSLVFTHSRPAQQAGFVSLRSVTFRGARFGLENNNSLNSFISQNIRIQIGIYIQESRMMVVIIYKLLNGPTRGKCQLQIQLMAFLYIISLQIINMVGRMSRMFILLSLVLTQIMEYFDTKKCSKVQLSLSQPLRCRRRRG